MVASLFGNCKRLAVCLCMRCVYIHRRLYICIYLNDVYTRTSYACAHAHTHIHPLCTYDQHQVTLARRVLMVHKEPGHSVQTPPPSRKPQNPATVPLRWHAGHAGKQGSRCYTRNTTTGRHNLKCQLILSMNANGIVNITAGGKSTKRTNTVPLSDSMLASLTEV